jgi:hypothetical protein
MSRSANGAQNWAAATAAACATLGGGTKKNGRKEEGFHGKWGGECMVGRSSKPCARSRQFTAMRKPRKYSTATRRSYYALPAHCSAFSDFCRSHVKIRILNPDKTWNFWIPFENNGCHKNTLPQHQKSRLVFLQTEGNQDPKS